MYEVFLSYRGQDIATTLITNLHRSFEQKRILTFKYEIERGSIISDSVLEAIRASKTAIVVISVNYASSASCLDELAEIIQVKRNGSLMVLPVFYGVNPGDVSRQSGAFGQQFRKILTKSPEKLQKWTDALTDLSSISGENPLHWYLLVPFSHMNFVFFLFIYFLFFIFPQ